MNIRSYSTKELSITIKKIGNDKIIHSKTRGYYVAGLRDNIPFNVFENGQLSYGSTLNKTTHSWLLKMAKKLYILHDLRITKLNTILANTNIVDEYLEHFEDDDIQPINYGETEDKEISNDAPLCSAEEKTNQTLIELFNSFLDTELMKNMEVQLSGISIRFERKG